MRGDEGMLKAAVQVDAVGVEEQPKLITTTMMMMIIVMMMNYGGL